MRFTLLAAIAAVTIPTIPAMAQSNPRQDYREDVREARQDYREDMRDARRDRRSNVRQNRDWRQYRNYDYNRYERGQSTYYAENYYRDGRYYQPRRLSRNDRIYRGGNGQYYCRRNDGTTGLIVGGLAGGLLGNSLSNGRSSTLGTLLGAGAGAALGSSIDRGNVRCR
jgi:Ni/Co efflux regulator RcnB